MGCDIHLFVERRESAGAPWKPILVHRKCTGWWHGQPEAERKGQCYSCKGSDLEAGYSNRNYDVFAVLAGVRNDDDHKPIAGPRGLPEDISPELHAIHSDESDDEEDWEASYEKNLKLYGCGSFGDHSFSHVTLAELLGYDWDRRVSISAVVTPYQFKTLLENGKPAGYCRGVGGGMVQFVSLRTMRAIAEGGTFGNTSDAFGDAKLLTLTPEAAEVVRRDGVYWNSSIRGENTLGFQTILGDERHLYAHVEWQESVKDRCGAFCESFIPALQAAAATGADNLRLVFGFDS